MRQGHVWNLVVSYSLQIFDGRRTMMDNDICCMSVAMLIFDK